MSSNSMKQVHFSTVFEKIHVTDTTKIPDKVEFLCLVIKMQPLTQSNNYHK